MPVDKRSEGREIVELIIVGARQTLEETQTIRYVCSSFNNSLRHLLKNQSKVA